MTRRPRITKAVRNRIRRLLYMEYAPSEIAEELGITKDTLYRGWLRAGAPHRRDETGRIWICGTDLAAWIQDMGDGPSVTLEEGEAFCLRCQKAIRIQGPVTREPSQRAVLVRGTCPQCGSGVARFEGVTE